MCKSDPRCLHNEHMPVAPSIPHTFLTDSVGKTSSVAQSLNLNEGEGKIKGEGKGGGSVQSHSDSNGIS